MKVIHDLAALHREKESIWLAAGFFDGVHRGHQAVIRRVIATARRHGQAPWIMTFDMHPLKLLSPHDSPPLLTSISHKIRLMEAEGLRGCIVLRFTRTTARMSPEKFIATLSRSFRKLSGMVIGSNWTFGRHGAGTPQLLKVLGRQHGFKVIVVQPKLWRRRPISSTRIRRALACGRLSDVSAMLGRDFSVTGKIVSGRKIGARLLGIPTANVDCHNEALPAAGVYAVRAILGGQMYGGVANLGRCPTVTACLPTGGRPRMSLSLEVHLFGVNKNLRGRMIEVFFVQKIRPEKRFGSMESLRQRIFADIGIAKRILARRKYKPAKITQKSCFTKQRLHL